MISFKKNTQNQNPQTTQKTPGYKSSGGNGKTSELSFEDIVYGQHGFFRRMSYKVADRLRITNAVKRAQVYRDRVEDKVDQMDTAIGKYLTEKGEIEKSINTLTKNTIEAEKKIKSLEEEVGDLKNTVGQMETEVEDLSKREDETGFQKYTERKKEFVEKKEEYEAKEAKLTKVRMGKETAEREIEREGERLTDYQAFVDDLVKERAELERYISIINDVIKDEDNLRGIPVIKRIRGI